MCWRKRVGFSNSTGLASRLAGGFRRLGCWLLGDRNEVRDFFFALIRFECRCSDHSWRRRTISDDVLSDFQSRQKESHGRIWIDVNHVATVQLSGGKSQSGDEQIDAGQHFRLITQWSSQSCEDSYNGEPACGHGKALSRPTSAHIG